MNAAPPIGRLANIPLSGMLRAILAVAILGSCARADPGPAVPITFATGICDGTCPAWEATVTPAGGVYRGGQFSRVQGARRFPLTAEQYHAIALALAPIRPSGTRALYPDRAGCEQAANDMRTIEVSWGKSDRLTFYTGCEGSENGRILDALLRVEQLLPVNHLAGH